MVYAPNIGIGGKLYTGLVEPLEKIFPAHAECPEKVAAIMHRLQVEAATFADAYWEKLSPSGERSTFVDK